MFLPPVGGEPELCTPISGREHLRGWRRDYEDHVIKTFYLSNANPNDVVNTLRGLLDARRIATNPALNAITIRDTPAKIAVMERVIEANDKPPSEVVIDVEILEVQEVERPCSYGTGLSTYSVTEVLEQPDTVNGVRGCASRRCPYINASDWLLTFPSLIYRRRRTRATSARWPGPRCARSTASR